MAEKLSYSYDEGPYTPEKREEDFKEHASTYKLFLGIVKWSVIVTTAILVLLYLFLVL